MKKYVRYNDVINSFFPYLRGRGHMYNIQRLCTYVYGYIILSNKAHIIIYLLVNKMLYFSSLFFCIYMYSFKCIIRTAQQYKTYYLIDFTHVHKISYLYIAIFNFICQV